MPLQIITGNILTTVQTDAIVNTTNSRMIGYSGIDAALRSAAGPELEAYCRSAPLLEPGDAWRTPGFRLPFRHIIHTVGPVWVDGSCGEVETLHSCYRRCLHLALSEGCESIVFPLISSGNNGLPRDLVLHEAVRAIRDFLEHHELDVYLCVYSPDAVELQSALFGDLQRYLKLHGPLDSAAFLCADECAPSPAPSPEQKRRPSLRRERDVPQQRRGFLSSLGSAAEMLPRKKPSRRKTDHFSEALPVPKPDTAFPESEACESPMPEPFSAAAPLSGLSLEEYLKQMDKGFSDTLFMLIDQRGMTDVECYTSANVDRRVFSKIKCNPDYRPSKQTVLAFAIALKLDMGETDHLLSTAGYQLSGSILADCIVQYFILNRRYDIFEINEALFNYDQRLLGSAAG